MGLSVAVGLALTRWLNQLQVPAQLRSHTQISDTMLRFALHKMRAHLKVINFLLLMIVQTVAHHLSGIH